MRPPIFSVTPMRSSGSREDWKIFFVIFTKLIPRKIFFCIAKILVLMVSFRVSCCGGGGGLRFFSSSGCSPGGVVLEPGLDGVLRGARMPCLALATRGEDPIFTPTPNPRFSLLRIFRLQPVVLN